MDRYRNERYKQNFREREPRGWPSHKYFMDSHPRKYYNRPYRNNAAVYSPRTNRRYLQEPDYQNEKGAAQYCSNSHPKKRTKRCNKRAGSWRTEVRVTPPPPTPGFLRFSALPSPEYNPENAFLCGFEDQTEPESSNYKSPSYVIDGEGDILMMDADSSEPLHSAELERRLGSLEAAWLSAEDALVSWRKDVIYRLKALEDMLESEYKYSRGRKVEHEILRGESQHPQVLSQT